MMRKASVQEICIQEKSHVIRMTRSYTKPNGFFHLFFITVAIGILMKFSLCLSITTICLWAYYESQKVVEETITLIRGLGIQCQESTLFTKREPIFIEKKRIKQCYLNEGFLACDIIFFLTLEIEMEDGEINNKLVFKEVSGTPWEELQPAWAAIRAFLAEKP